MHPRGSLPDHIRPGLHVLIVGINPGLRSATLGHHYAGHSNRFWKLLSESKLVPSPLDHRDDWRLPQWGLGLTNLVARPTAGMIELTGADFVQGRRRLVAKVRRYRPRIVALLGLSLLSILHPALDRPRRSRPARSRRTGIGWQRETLAGARLFVLPNPSGRNAHYSYSQMLACFVRLRRSLVTSALSKNAI